MLATRTQEEMLTYIPGPAGELEALVAQPKAEERNAWGIVCHPHPLYGGTMQNKVVTILVRTFQGLGARTVRFNFRGVGRSVGSYDEGRGELDDLIAVIDWVQQEKVKDEMWLAGFSFGAYIAAVAATQLPLTKLVTVAPPISHFSMQQLPPITCQWVLAQGQKDELVDAEEVLAWAEKRDPKPTVLLFPEATHFFHGQLIELRERLTEALR